MVHILPMGVPIESIPTPKTKEIESTNSLQNDVEENSKSDFTDK